MFSEGLKNREYGLAQRIGKELNNSFRKLKYKNFKKCDKALGG